MKPIALLVCAVAMLAHAAEVRRLEGTSLCPECLKEPLEMDYWPVGQSSEPPRLKATDPDARSIFDRAVRTGKVLILENATLGGAMAGWSCQRMAKELPNAKMRREYDWDDNPGDENRQRMGDQRWIHEKQSGEDAQERLMQDPDSPPYAPFYWGVRESAGGNVGDQQTVEKVRGLIEASVPKAVDPRNARSMFGNAEFWMGAYGTGARAHMDSHCISTLSVVLKGSRRWRIGPPPRMPHRHRSNEEEVVFDDGVAYRLGWKPLYEFTVHEGEGLLFPPGWIHETFNNADECTSALTTQLAYPAPSTYMREFYSRCRRVGDLGACWDQMIRWGESGSELAAADTDANGQVDAEELARSDLSDAAVDFYKDADDHLDIKRINALHREWHASEQAVSQLPEVLPSKLRFDLSFTPEAASRSEL